MNEKIFNRQRQEAAGRPTKEEHPTAERVFDHALLFRRFRGILLLLAVCGLSFFAFLALWNSLEKRVLPAREDVKMTVSYPPPSVSFQTDYEKALKTAMERQQPLLLFFMESGCPFSQRMMNETFADQDVAALSEAYCLVQIDLSRPESESLARRFNVTGSPTLQFLSVKGMPLRQIAGFETADELKHQMDSVLCTIAWHESNRLLR